MHLIRRRRQEPGLVLYLRARVLRAAFRQGPDGPELVRVGGPEDGGQAPGKVGQEFGGAPAMVHVLQNRVAGRSHGVVQDLGNGLQPCQCSGTVWPLRSGAVVVRPGRLSDASRGRCGATALPGPLRCDGTARAVTSTEARHRSRGAREALIRMLHLPRAAVIHSRGRPAASLRADEIGSPHIPTTDVVPRRVPCG